MKKVICLILLISAVAFSQGSFEASEEILEVHFEAQHPVITDGSNTLKDIEYDLTISQNKALIELEIESSFGDGGWSKLNKQIFEEIILQMIADIKLEVNNPNLDVTALVKLDREFDNDEILFNRTY